MPIYAPDTACDVRLPDKRNISIMVTECPLNSAASFIALPALLCPSPVSQDKIRIFKLFNSFLNKVCDKCTIIFLNNLQCNKRLTYLSSKLIVVEDIATKGLHKMF